MCTPRKAVEAMIRNLRIEAGEPRGKDLLEDIEDWYSIHTAHDWVWEYEYEGRLFYHQYAYKDEGIYILVSRRLVVIWSRSLDASVGHITVELKDGRINAAGHSTALVESLARTVQDVSPF